MKYRLIATIIVVALALTAAFIKISSSSESNSVPPDTEYQEPTP